MERFEGLDPIRFWFLDSGRTVEEVLHNASLLERATVKYVYVYPVPCASFLKYPIEPMPTGQKPLTRICRIRSYTIDFQCTEIQALFTPEEWAEISRKDSFELPPLPTPVENYMSSVRQAMLAGRPVYSVPLPEVESFACHLIQMSCITW